jgi:hypothetical protein
MTGPLAAVERALRYIEEDDLDSLKELLPQEVPIDIRLEEYFCQFRRTIATWHGLKTTILHAAAGFGSEFCLPYLLANGADVHATDGVSPVFT